MVKVEVAWDITSDKRMKDLIRYLPYGLDVVNQLKPVDYFIQMSPINTPL